MSHMLATHAQYAGFGSAMFPPGVRLLIDIGNKIYIEFLLFLRVIP